MHSAAAKPPGKFPGFTEFVTIVALMMAVVEATSPVGSVLGAIVGNLLVAFATNRRYA